MLPNFYFELQQEFDNLEHLNLVHNYNNESEFRVVLKIAQQNETFPSKTILTSMFQDILHELYRLKKSYADCGRTRLNACYLDYYSLKYDEIIGIARKENLHYAWDFRC